ncbi:MAG: hypothetical protein NTV54_16685 [Ignavibacteriales bacterium]|nr:hypothetical protein [Ignavibacteriales bacterium]
MNSRSGHTRFGMYEILRIAVPGLYATFLAYFFLAGFSFTLLPLAVVDAGSIGFFILALVAGLTFYAKEAPKRRQAFRANQPSSFLLDRSKTLSVRSPLSEDDARRLYFYVLNNHMPPPFHEKIFFFGMIYSIMINIRRTSFWFTCIGIIGLLVKFSMTGRFFIESLIPVAFVGIIYILNVRYNKADRKMQENYQDQIFWLEMNHDLIDGLIRERSGRGDAS